MKKYATGVQHIGIPTEDMQASMDFYQKLGFTTAYETVFDGAAVVFLKLENLVLEIYESKCAAKKAGAIDHIAIDVLDVEQVYQEICRMEMNTLQDAVHFLPFWSKGVKFFTIEGPNAEKIEFSQFL